MAEEQKTGSAAAPAAEVSFPPISLTEEARRDLAPLLDVESGPSAPRRR